MLFTSPCWRSLEKSCCSLLLVEEVLEVRAISAGDTALDVPDRIQYIDLACNGVDRASHSVQEITANQPETLASIAAYSAERLKQCLLAVQFLADQESNTSLTSVVITPHQVLLGDNDNVFFSQVTEDVEIVLVFEDSQLFVSCKLSDLGKIITSVVDVDQSSHSVKRRREELLDVVVEVVILHRADVRVIHLKVVRGALKEI